MTNTTKALIIAALNEVLVLLVAFGVSMSDAQIAAVGGTLNAALALWVALTYKNSRKRIAG